jgi:hypothetical protein
MRMDVLHSSATMLELAFADVGIQIGASEPVSLPVLERGRIVRLSLRQWDRYPNYEWFVAVHDDASRELLFALHKANLGLFEGSVFGESNALGFELSVSDVCETFEPKHECTSKGARLTQLAVDVNASESAVPVRISSGETSTISLNGRDTRIWVGRALRIRIEDYFGCADSIPEDDLHFAVW